MTDERCDLLCLDLPLAERLRADLPSAAAFDVAAARARALADPTRALLATLLRDGGELCVCDLAWVSGRSQKLVSHHMRVLRRDELAASRRDGKMVLYRLTPVGRRALAAVMPEAEVLA